MDINGLIVERDELRQKWRDCRKMRLEHKAVLLRSGISIQSVRHDREYRILKKKQETLSTRLRHIEKEIVRILNVKRNR